MVKKFCNTILRNYIMIFNVNALWGKSKPSCPYNRRHAPVLTSLISLWELHQWSSPLPVLPSVQSSRTCLCLETSLPMQRSHWHLMSQHFSRKLVSGISTATTNSVPCIVGLLKPRRYHDVVTSKWMLRHLSYLRIFQGKNPRIIPHVDFNRSEITDIVILVRNWWCSCRVNTKHFHYHFTAKSTQTNFWLCLLQLRWCILFF